jgi:poly-gamma-glutamate capsule biosynthesis protein CapA/YwtB (metallophosphatase superfamily)/murein endopeptidase
MKNQIKNKKAGHEFMIILLGVVIFSMIMLMLIIVDLEGKTRTMGEAATEVMKTAQEGDNLVNYVDVSAKHAVRDTEYNLALKGGIASTECGEFNGVPYWYVDGKLCLPKNYKTDFKTMFNTQFYKYLEGFDSYFNLDEHFNIPQNFYEYKFIDNNIIGVAKDEIAIEGDKVDVPTYFSFESQIKQEQATTMTVSSGETIKLVFGGDATTLDQTTNPFSNILQEFQNALVFINLETLITELPYQQYMIDGKLKEIYHFRVLPKHADYMKQSNIAVVTLANNHAGDFGKQGVQDTISYLEQNNIAYCGATKTSSEPGQNTQTIVTADNGIKVGFVCYTEYVNSHSKQGSHDKQYCGNVNELVNIFGQNKLQQDITSARQAGADIVIASLHWGTSSDDTPQDHISGSRAAINAGADLVIGHGPHRVQGIEFIEKNSKQKVIVYSLGNLLSGKGIENSQISKLNTGGEARKALLFSIDIDKQANVHGYKVTPLDLGAGAPKIASEEFKQEIIKNVIDRSSNYPNGYKQDQANLITQSTIDVAYPAIDDSGCQISQFPFNSESVGHTSNGMLKNPATIKKETTHYYSHKHSRNRFYGTIELVNMIEKAGCITAKAIGARIDIHDLSDKEGGKLSGHASHQSGRDVDMGLYFNKNNKVYNDFEDATGSKIKYFDANANWILIKALLASGNIKAIYLDQQLINKLKEYAQQSEPDQTIIKKAFSKLKHWKSHKDHYHVRIYCPIDDNQCKE